MDRRDFIETVKSKLDDLDRQIAKMEANIKETGEAASERTSQALEDLRKYRSQMAEKLREAEAAGEDSWSRLEARATEAWDALSRGASDAVDRLRRTGTR